MTPGTSPLHPSSTARHRGCTTLLLAALMSAACAGPAAAATATVDTLRGAPGAALPLATSVTASPTLAHPPLAGAIRSDRLAHASFAVALGVGIGTLSDQPAAAAASTIALSLAKELLDERFDRGDLAAGVVGAGLAALIVAALRR